MDEININVAKIYFSGLATPLKHIVTLTLHQCFVPGLLKFEKVIYNRL